MGTPRDPSPKPQGGAEPPRSDPHPSGRILAVRARGSPPLGPFFATSDPILAVFSTKMCFEIGSFRDKNVFRSTIHPGPTKIVDFGGLNAMQRHVTPFSVDFGRGYGEGLAPPTPGAPGVPPPLGPGTCCGSRGVGPYSTRVAAWSPRGARGPPPPGAHQWFPPPTRNWRFEPGGLTLSFAHECPTWVCVASTALAAGRTART